MSDNDQPLSEPHDDDDLLAAEYVLGLLDGADWKAARDRAAVDPEFNARVQAWEGRLAPLNAEFTEHPAPDLLPQIEARLFPAKPRRRSSWGWGLLTGGIAALGLMLALIVFVPPQPRAPALQAELVDDSRALVLQARYYPVEGMLDVITSGPTAGDGLDYELWVIDDSGVPRSVGLLQETETRLSAALLLGQTLAVSLEPEGGSPSDLPTGPVLATAQLAEP